MDSLGFLRRSVAIVSVTLLLAAALISMVESEPAGAQDADSDASTARPSFLQGEIEAEGERLERTHVTITGRVTGPDGPIEAAIVEIGSHRFVSESDGGFTVPGVARHTHLATVSADGYLSRVIPVGAGVAMGRTAMDLGDIRLLRSEPGRYTMVFGGDVSLGRRYLDPSGQADHDEVPRGDHRALINVDNARADTAAVLNDYATIVAPYDLVSINLETVVTDDPADPQPGQYLFFTLPDSAQAVADAGVDYVSLGNNHVWDYGTQGVLDTHKHIDATGMAHSGSGADSDEAFAPALLTVGASLQPVAMHSWVATRNPPEEYPPHATETKAGGASASDFDRMFAAVAETEASEHLSVAHLHIGYEYTEQPESSDPELLVQQRLEAAVDAGADLVIAHHPHVAQGFAIDDGVLVAHSLGNLAFDQERLDTFFGAMLAVAFDGEELVDARVEPIFISDFEPTLATGDAADQLLRRLSFVSSGDVVLVPDAGAGAIERRGDVERNERTITVPLVPDDNGIAMIDLRTLRGADESIGWISGSGVEDGEQVSLGRDLMLTFGDFEDRDTDGLPGETGPWRFGSAGFVCGSEARRGVGAICSIRTSTNENPSSLSFGARIRVEGDRINQPNRDVTVLLYEQGRNRGDLGIEVEYTASQGGEDFGDVEVARLPAGSGDYTAHWIDLDIPEEDPAGIAGLPANRPFSMAPQRDNARAIRLGIEHYPPPEGTGLATIDDVAVVSWSAPTLTSDGIYRTPSPHDFLRIEGVELGATVEVTFHSYVASL